MDLTEVTNTPPRRHPWEEARFAFFFRVLRDARLLRPGARVLDVGAGDAWFAQSLASRAPLEEVVCLDTGYAEHGSPPDAARVRYTAAAPEGRFDVVLALDVAEHVEDDRAFLSRIAREHVRDGGRLLFSVPAWPFLFSSHDERLGHRRRYTPAEGKALLASCGLRVVRGGGLFPGLFLARSAQKLLERAGGAGPSSAGEWSGGAVASAVLRGALALDESLSGVFSRISLDVPGLSWWALCTSNEPS